MTPPDPCPSLAQIFRERIVLIDGAVGTMIQARGLSEADFRGERFADHPRDLVGPGEVLVLTRPQVIDEIHRGYLEAGADVICTATFNATSIAQREYALEDCAYDLTEESALVSQNPLQNRWRAHRDLLPSRRIGFRQPDNLSAPERRG